MLSCTAINRRKERFYNHRVLSVISISGIKSQSAISERRYNCHVLKFQGLICNPLSYVILIICLSLCR